MSIDVHNQEHSRQTPLMENAKTLKQSMKNGARSSDIDTESGKS